jgi:uncharacterized membrane protein
MCVAGAVRRAEGVILRSSTRLYAMPGLTRTVPKSFVIFGSKRVRGLMSERRIETEIEINAPAARVWALLTDFDGMGSWNPFIKSVSGTLA